MNGIEAGKAYVKFLLEDKDLKRRLTKIGTDLKKVGKIGMAATAPLVAGFAAATKAALDYGDGLGDMAARTGIAVDKLSELQFAADQSDVSITSLERGIQRMTMNIGNAANGTGTFSRTLNTLGVSLEDLRGQAPDQQFALMADALAKIEDPAQRAALAQQVFGKAAQQMLPLIAQGSAGLATMAARARELGIVLSEEDAEALGKLDQALKVAKQQLFGLSVQIGTAVAGPFTDFMKSIEPMVREITTWIRTNPTLTATIIKVTAAVAGMSAATYALGTALTVISAHPVLAAIVAITGAIVALKAAMDAVPQSAEEMQASIENSSKGALRAWKRQNGIAVEEVPTQVAAGMAASATARQASSALPDSSSDAQAFATSQEALGILGDILKVEQAHFNFVRNQRNGGLIAGAE
jgi:hypothetical protein